MLLRDPTFRQTLPRHTRLISFEISPSFDTLRGVVASQAVLKRRAKTHAISEVFAVHVFIAGLLDAVTIAVVHETSAKVVVLRVKRARRLARRHERAIDQGHVLSFAPRVLVLALDETRAFFVGAEFAQMFARRFDTRLDGDAIGTASFLGHRAIALEAHVALTPRPFAGARTRSLFEVIGIDRDPTRRRGFDANIVHAAEWVGAVVCPGTTVPRKTTPKSVFLVATRRDKRA